MPMIICADDYGLRKDIDRAILELCKARRLSAVSCMTLLERCNSASMAHLVALASSVEIGLHLCFTHEEQPLSGDAKFGSGKFPTYSQLLRQALFRTVNPREIADEIAQQYEIFRDKSGRRPDFIDGHLHTHQLPVIRQALVKFVLKLPPLERPYIRNTRMDMRTLRENKLPRFKAGLISWFGSRMAKRLREAGLVSNDGFAGVYDFKMSSNYPWYFPGFMQCLRKPSGILVVHPGLNEEWRCQEFAVLQNYPFSPNQPNRFRS